VNLRRLLLVGCAAPALAVSLGHTGVAADDTVPPPLPNPAPTPRPAPPAAPAPAPAPAPHGGDAIPPAPPAGTDAQTLGLQALDEAARWIAKGANPPDRLTTLHTDIDYVYDDGQNHDERRMELWFRNPDAFHAYTKYAGRDSELFLIGEQGWLIRDRIRVTPLNQSATYKELLPAMKQYRDVLREVARLMAPSALKGPGITFTLQGHVRDPKATGGAWYRVLRKAPGEADMTFFFGTAPNKEGTGTRAIAPDKLVISGFPGSNYAGDEYRLEGWVHQDAAARNEQFRYPRTLRLYAIGLDPENKPTFRGTVSFLEINVQAPEGVFDPPR
jgi:hypothetical protein